MCSNYQNLNYMAFNEQGQFVRKYSRVNGSVSVNPNGDVQADNDIAITNNPPPNNGGNAGANVNTPPDIIPSNGTSNPTNPNITANPQGSDTSSGGVNSNSASFPNIYFNFKRNNYSSSNLKFKFTTDSLNSDNISTNTWSGDSEVKAGSANLVGDSGCLTSATAYGKYFYELGYNKSISNNSFLLFPDYSPSYAVLVFALANTSTSGNIYTDFKKILETAIIHKFLQTESDGSADDVYNFGLSSAVVNAQEVTLGKAVFTAGSLNSSVYFNNYSNETTPGVYRGKNGDRSLLNPNSNFYFDSKNGSNRSVYTDAVFNDLRPFNLYNLPTNLASPTALTDVVVTKNGSSTNYKNFCMFFVEMRSYIAPTSTYANSNQLYFETYVNGILTFQAWVLADKTLNTGAIKNYTISLSNKSATGSDPGNKLFLFDYLYGSSYNINEMQRESRNTVSSLVSRYRNILIKNTSDLQITNSNTSLAFPVKSSHPFLSLFLASKTK
jgi:hypothetical protein